MNPLVRPSLCIQVCGKVCKFRSRPHADIRLMGFAMDCLWMLSRSFPIQLIFVFSYVYVLLEG